MFFFGLVSHTPIYHTKAQTIYKIITITFLKESTKFKYFYQDAINSNNTQTLYKIITVVILRESTL